jgi:hypothetical protein
MSAWRRPAAAAAVLACAVAGAFALPALRLEPFPSEPPSRIRIELTDPAAERAVLDERVARPLETALGALEHVREVESRVGEGRVRIEVSVAPRAAAEALVRVRARVLEEMSQLPATLDAPRVVLLDPARPAVRLAVRAADRTPEQLMAWAEEQLVQPLRLMPGVAAVSRDAYARQEFDVLPDPRRLGALGLTILDVAAALKRTPLAGREALAAAPVRLPAGDTLPLSTMAQIEERNIAPAPQAPLALAVETAPGADRLALLRLIEAHVEWLRANGQLGAGTQVEIAPPRAGRLRALGVAGGAAALGLLLAGVAVAAARGARTAVGFALAMLLAFAGAAALLVAAGRALTAPAFVAFAATAAIASAALILRRAGRMPTGLLFAATAAGGGFWVVPLLWSGEGLAINRELLGSLLAALVVALVLVGLLYRASRMPPAGLWANVESRLASLAGRPRWVAIVAVTLPVATTAWIAVQPWSEPVAAGEPIEWRLRLYGTDSDRLAQTGNEALERLEGADGLDGLAHSLEPLALQWRSEVDPEQAQALGVEPDDVGRIVRLSLEGRVVAEFGEGFRRSVVRVRLSEAERARADVLERLVVAGELPGRPLVPLPRVAYAGRRWDYVETRRDTRGDFVEITGTVRGHALGDAMRTVRARLAGLPSTPEAGWVGTAARLGRTQWLFVAALAAGLVIAGALAMWRLRTVRALVSAALGTAAAAPGVAVGIAVGGAFTPPVAMAGLLLAGIGAAAALVTLTARRGGPPVAGTATGAWAGLAGGMIPLFLLWDQGSVAGFAVTLAAGIVPLTFVVALGVPACYLLGAARGPGRMNPGGNAV